MKFPDEVYAAAIAILAVFFLVSMYDEFFGETSGYTFEEFGHKCIAVEEQSE